MMTGEGVTGCRDSNFVGLLAVHLVGQVIEEAYIIANATSESGQGYQDIMQSYRSNRPTDIVAVDEIIVSKGNYYMNEVKTDNTVNIVATSTPQKLQVSGESEKRDVSNFIGQGDEDTNLYKNELTKSTSMLLNHLFDMSDVEKIICDDPSLARNDSYLNNAFGMTFAVEVNADNNTNDQISTTSERSSFSLLADASMTKNEEVKLSKDTVDILGGSHAYVNSASVEVQQTADIGEISDIGEKQNENVVDGYENTYLTLNRDYDQGSEDDIEVILQDPRVLSLHEIELITANTSDDDLRAPELKEEQNNLVATSTVAASENTSRKSTLARRFKIRGVKLLSCFKGWWYRKTPTNNKENRTTILKQGPIQICPLSPNARRRAASSLDDRVHRAPSPSRPIVWKFNTIADPLISSRWKDYTFDDKPENVEN